MQKLQNFIKKVYGHIGYCGGCFISLVEVKLSIFSCNLIKQTYSYEIVEDKNTKNGKVINRLSLHISIFVYCVCSWLFIYFFLFDNIVLIYIYIYLYVFNFYRFKFIFNIFKYIYFFYIIQLNYSLDINSSCNGSVKFEFIDKSYNKQ